MTLFATIIASLGLSYEQAAEYLDVRVDTVSKWARAEDPVPKGVMAELRELAKGQERTAKRIVAEWTAPDGERKPLRLKGLMNGVVRRVWEQLPTASLDLDGVIDTR